MILAPGSLESQKQHALRAHPDRRSGTKHSHTCTHIRGPGWGGAEASGNRSHANSQRRDVGIAVMISNTCAGWACGVDVNTQENVLTFRRCTMRGLGGRRYERFNEETDRQAETAGCGRDAERER